MIPIYKGKKEHVVLMQFTGVKDKNGKEIYEGDILGVEYGYYPDTENHLWDGFLLVEWGGEDYPAFDVKPRLECSENGLSNLIFGESYFKVVGNIFENPELLEKVEYA